jgi:hypothetical protein
MSFWHSASVLSGCQAHGAAFVNAKQCCSRRSPRTSRQKRSLRVRRASGAGVGSGTNRRQRSVEARLAWERDLQPHDRAARLPRCSVEFEGLWRVGRGGRRVESRGLGLAVANPYLHDPASCPRAASLSAQGDFDFLGAPRQHSDRRRVFAGARGLTCLAVVDEHVNQAVGVVRHQIRRVRPKGDEPPVRAEMTRLPSRQTMGILRASMGKNQAKSAAVDSL